MMQSHATVSLDAIRTMPPCAPAYEPPARADVSGRAAAARRAAQTGTLARYIAHEPKPLPEFQLYQPRAGHPDWPVLMQEARELAAELRPLLSKPDNAMRNLRRRMSSYRTLAQNYLYNRKLTQDGREDLRPLYFIWTLLRTCNFACEYCDDHQGHRYPELSNEGVLDTEQAKQLLKVMRTRTPSVYFAGGEPTIREDLPELTRHAHALGYYPIIINTNGSLLHRQLRKPQWHDWLANMDIIIVSLDGLDLEMLNGMWVYRRSDDVIRNLLMLRELRDEMGFKLMVNCVIQPGHTDEARAVLDFANDMGIHFCQVPVNVGPVVDGHLLTDPGYAELAETILERKKARYKISGSLRMNRRLLYAEPLNCRNTIKPHIDYDGNLVWPCKACVNVKPDYVNVLKFDHVDDLYRYASSRINPTRFHGPAANQCGANCNWAQNYSTDAYVQGLRNPMSLVRDVFDFLAG